MFFDLFSSKNKKIVKRWMKEHEEIVTLAHKIIAAYSSNNHILAKKELISLNNTAVNHLMNEDIELYKLLKKRNDMHHKIESDIKKFKENFSETKINLMKFLTYYSKAETPLDESFFDQFNSLVGILGERIDFEENNLYQKLEAI
ncbi:MAG TPA: hypothetical protein CFH81_05260 [Sulfurovum sp. UBA12169]|nr:MAG TPA: hypothetical protein CFH81_05260 [Sulfurovum sp. UBA12169]